MDTLKCRKARCRPYRVHPVLCLWNECRKRSQQQQLAVCRRRWESKMEIPAYAISLRGDRRERVCNSWTGELLDYFSIASKPGAIRSFR
jgi:hypothetical protein